MSGDVTWFDGLKSHGKTLSTAESCTGGGLAQAITAISGASSVYCGGVVSYWSEVKASVLGVSQELLDAQGAVCADVAKAMATGVQHLTGSDYALSTTGVAGPDKDDRGNDVGLVFIALATPEGVAVKECRFGNLSRHEIQQKAIETALNWLGDML
ncbi:CinA family protein [Bengtsoniella intestinalis]|uniref:CinA family protein n=1 Tax=Bengtsoniella intestinalis TaxID=3073143 RepID=UPI00391F4689